MIWLWIALAGAGGAVLRYGVVRWSADTHNLVIAGVAWPVGTLIVNTLGCLVAGLLIGWLQTRSIIDQRLLVVLMAGFLGAFTTFSAFALDTLAVYKEAGLFYAGINVFLTNLLSILAAIGGYKLSTMGVL